MITEQQAEDHMVRARAALRRGDALNAIVHAQALVRAHQRLGESTEILGVAHAMAGNTRQAIETLMHASEIDPRRASAHFNLAFVLNKAGRVDEAVEEIQTALLIRPDYPQAQQLYDEVKRRLKDRNCHSDENFAVVDAKTNPLAQTTGQWAKIECASCGALNFITARTCARCGSYLPEEEEIIPRE